MMFMYGKHKDKIKEQFTKYNLQYIIKRDSRIDEQKPEIRFYNKKS